MIHRMFKVSGTSELRSSKYVPIFSSYLSASVAGSNTTKSGKILGGEYLCKTLYNEYLNSNLRIQGLNEVMSIRRMG